MQKVHMLQQCGVQPVIVFDGGKLPMKAAEEGSRGRHEYVCMALIRTGLQQWFGQKCDNVSATAPHHIHLVCRARKENRDKAAAHVKAGNKQAAYECYQRAVDISSATANDLAKVWHTWYIICADSFTAALLC